MQVLQPNDVKIYNLSSGKSLPEWLSSKKKKKLLKKDVDIRRRIELLQDFEMPGVSTSVKISNDGHYILATGIYKPRVRCFEVDNLSMKFERCFDSEVITFEILSEDYTKIAFLQHDRFVEFHAAGGRYFRLRIPKYGRDLKYHYATCDLLTVGVSNEIYRLNLERGQFLSPWLTDASEINTISINKCHQLVVVGSKEGKIEAWDPRAKTRVGVLDTALHCITEFPESLEGFPSVTRVEFNGALTLGVGVATGQVLLYDIRSNKPSVVKDHMYNLPIRDIAFHNQHVLSMDSACVKIWNKHDSKLLTFIESGSETMFNNLCHIPNSGLLFIANENTKILAYYIPALAQAPRWCSFLDNLTEELEESKVDTVYDDYKFVPKSELIDLGLGHLIGTSMARAYMHGYFINVKLWRKAKEASEPFNYEEYRRKKLREKLEAERPNRVQVDKLPKVNKELALKLMEDEKKGKKKKKNAGNLLQDVRFKAMFENPDFQVNPNSEEYRLMNPVVSRLDAERRKELQKEMLKEKFELVEEDEERKSSDDDLMAESEESSDDEKEWAREVKKQHRQLRKEKEMMEREKEKEEDLEDTQKRNQVKLYQLKSGQQFSGIKSLDGSSNNRLTLGERVELEGSTVTSHLARGNREMTYKSYKGKKKKNTKEQMLKHKIERKKVARRVSNSISGFKQPWKRMKR